MYEYIVNLMNFMDSKKSMVKFLFYILLCLVIHIWIIQYFYYFADNLNIIMSVARKKNSNEFFSKNSKYILVWNKFDNILKSLRLNNNLLECSQTKCIFTEDKNLLHYTQYDAIIFNEYALNSIDRPKTRSKSQFYVYSSQKSSQNALACDVSNDNFFNLTFTYKLDSDVLWPYIVVRNISGDMVAPSATVVWNNSISTVSTELKTFLKQKIKAAIWVVNGGHGAKVDRSVLEYIETLQEHLFHYSLKIDVYGRPPSLKCPKNDCHNLIRDKYYFYIAFENSFSEDYVTNTVLDAYNNHAVPIVYGGANYTRFLPPGSYIDAREIHPYNLASMLHQAIKDPTLYESYFEWKRLYSVEDNSKSLEPLCNLCDAINMYRANAVIKVGKEFRRWWNGLNGMMHCLSVVHWNASAQLLVNTINQASHHHQPIKTMHCQICQKPLRSSEGVKCEDCESRYHVKCVSSIKDLEGGDQGYQWRCAVCKHPAGRCVSHSQSVLTAINQIREKFEVVNKIQLPKLNSDLLLLKSTADRIVKQNDDILSKINQLQIIEQKKMVKEQFQNVNPSHSHRRKPLNLSRTTTEENDEVPMLTTSEKCARYKTRRRSYHLNKVFLLVNRKLRRTRTPRNKSPR